jgi:Brp/Blh family beta-carotene 15,15'-monooxygenase
MNAIDVQGRVFMVAAILGLATSLFVPFPVLEIQLLVMLVLVIALGVPHGALDLIFAKRLLALHTRTGWSVFLIAYLGLAALVVLIWRSFPWAFLIGFLAMSMFHFSGDLKDRAPLPLRLLYGGGIIFFPAALHAEPLGQLFSLLIGSPEGRPLADALHTVAWPWLALTGIIAAWNLKKTPAAALETISVAAALTLMPPILGFTLYFCLMHSARHVLRTKHFAQASWQRLIRIAAGPMIGTLVLGYWGWQELADSGLTATIVQTVFVGLAALTVPHMALVERVRWQETA